MKYLAAVQARMDSTRLPGKILMELGGKPNLQRVIERAAKSRFVDEVMLITSIEKSDIPTVNFVSGLGYRVFAGSVDDVLDRYYQSAKLFDTEYVIRVTGDCPLYDAKLLDDAIEKMQHDTDYMGAMTETLADGTDIEIIKFSALKKAHENAKLKSEREHVTLYIRNHPEIFKLQNYECPLGNLNSHRWTLDEPCDYDFISKIYAHFGEADFYSGDILSYLEKNPALCEINSAIKRNEGLQKSLNNDSETEVK